MKFFLSTTVLASVMAPAFSFSYLDQLGGGAAAAPAAFSPPAAAAPVAPAIEPFAGVPAASDWELTPLGQTDTDATNYKDSLNTGLAETSGSGVMTHVDLLNTGISLQGGAGIQTYAAALPAASAVSGGSGINTYCDALSPDQGGGLSDYSGFGSSSVSSGSAAASTDGVSFSLETGDISGFNLSDGGTLRLTGTIENISIN